MQEDTVADAAKQEMFNQITAKFDQALADKNNLPYAVTQALNSVVQHSKETTIQAMYAELQTCSEVVLEHVRTADSMGDRTLLSLQCLIKIYFRMSQKVDYEQGIDQIKSTICLKGINLAEHALHFNQLIRKFSEPHLREGMVSFNTQFSFDHFIDGLDPQLLELSHGCDRWRQRARSQNQSHHN